MGVYIKGMEMPTTEQGVRTINIYADGVVTNYAEVTIGKAVPVPEHGRLIDADEFLKRAIGTKCFHGDYALMLEELVGESATIIPAEPAEEGEI